MDDEIELDSEVDEEAYRVKAVKAFLAKEILLEDLQVSLERRPSSTKRPFPIACSTRSAGSLLRAAAMR